MKYDFEGEPLNITIDSRAFAVQSEEECIRDVKAQFLHIARKFYPKHKYNEENIIYERN